PTSSIVFEFGPALPGHANGMLFAALGRGGAVILSETYYSIGGGFVVTSDELKAPVAADPVSRPYPFDSAAAMLAMARGSGLSIAAMKRANEEVSRTPQAVEDGLARIWAAMSGCIDRGLAVEGEVPGGLPVKRRAKP